MFAAIIKGIFQGGIDNIITQRLIPDRVARKKAQYQLTALTVKAIAAGEAAQAEDRQGQLAINLAEAAHRNLFVSGWRPCVGWLCAIGVGWAFIGLPLADFALDLAKSDILLPQIPEDRIFELIMALLGMGTLRTVEKLAGKARRM